MKRSRLIFTAFATAILTLIGPAQSAFAALSPADYIGQGIYYYGKEDAVCSSGGISGSLTGDSNTEKALNFMMQNGFTLAGAAGVIGNWQQESGVRPNIKQTPSGGEIVGPDYVLEKGIGFGLAQWTFPSRQAALTAYMKKNNLQITDLGGQLNFFLEEFKLYKDFESVKNATDPVTAAIEFHNGYEGSSDTPEQVREKRGKYAQDTFDKYKDKITTTGSGSSTTSSGCNSGTPAGKVIYYSQTDPKWADTPYAGSTIGPVGCGPTSMAMILASLVDKTITPDQVAAVAGDQDGGTSSHANLINGVNNKWGLNISTQPITLDQAIDFVSSGKGYVWMGGGGPGTPGEPPFTKGGHMVAMVGVTSDGKITIADPVGNNKDGAGQQHHEISDYTKAQIQASVGSMYGVPKK